MSNIDLLTPFLENGIRNTNFFNGRLLAAEDLRTEQAANRQQRAHVGQAAGVGIVHGLAVRLASSDPAETTVRIDAGLALNRAGEALSLPQGGVNVALVPAQEQQASNAGLFTTCTPIDTSAIPTGIGAYVLVMAPTNALVGSTSAVAASCGSRYAVEGVQFRLVHLDVDAPALAQRLSSSTRTSLDQLMAGAESNATLSQIRNILAHLCFGTEELLGTAELSGFPDDPFTWALNEAPEPTYGALDYLRQQAAISDFEVPLALIYWTQNRIRFVDIWSVQRRVTPRTLSPWATLFSDRRLAEAEAIVLQFQDHVQSSAMIPSSERPFAQARDYFRYLPPIGILPMHFHATQDFQRQPDAPVFFKGMHSWGPIEITNAQVEPLLRTYLSYGPIDLNTSGLQQAVQIYYYTVHGNILLPNRTTVPSQLYAIFTANPLPSSHAEREARLAQAEPAGSNRAVTEVFGIGARRAELLQGADIVDLAGLARAPAQEVAKVLNMNPVQADGYIQQARILAQRSASDKVIWKPTQIW